MGESPLRVESAAATDTVEISGSETVYPYTTMYGPPATTPVTEADAPAAALPGLASAEEEEDATAGEETANGQELSEDEQRQVQELKQRDQEVRTHEQAHKSVGGQYAGAMSFEYQQGPDGQRYAVGGEVSIDISKERDPAATAAKMRQVRAAALAPANPSAQDFSVAARASQLAAEARQETSEQRLTGANGAGEGEGEPGAAAADAVRDGVQAAGAPSGGGEPGPAAASLGSPFATNSPASLFSAARYGSAGGIRSRIDIVA